jgi:hypothetical protein
MNLIGHIVQSIFIFVVLASLAFSAEANGEELVLQVARQPDNTVIMEAPIRIGDRFFLDYTHSSDLTPVHDVFIIDQCGGIVLIEEDYDWYGVGLEFSSKADAVIDFTGKRTRVLLHRPCNHFLLRVGRVAGHVLTYNKHSVPLLSIAEGGDSVWVRTVRKGAVHD